MAKGFNPLAYFLKKDSHLTKNTEEVIIDEDEDTFMASYLKDVNGRVTHKISTIKKLVNGRKSIIHNQ